MLSRKTYFIREHVGVFKVALNDEPSPAKSILMLAAGLAVDIIYKEK
jgi:hypothetical protein